MATVLITAFEPYDRWEQNSSWLALLELTKDLPASQKIVTRRYPVDFAQARGKLLDDLAADYDYALLLGQAPGTARIHLEQIGINVGGHSQQLPDEFRTLADDGPVAYRSSLPLADWAGMIRELGIPCQVSHHAGTFLCNALLYLALHFIERQNLRTRATFIHLPLAPPQVFHQRQDLPSLPSEQCAAAIQQILRELA
jgi:pyroglutamyl-peptidase